MEQLIREWDGEFVVVRHDEQAEAWIFIAVHSTRLGMAAGGTRMKVYDSPRDALHDAQRLAEGMTYKWAGIDFPLGGGKATIALSRPLVGDERERFLERYGAVVESLRGAFSTGADLGAGPEEVKIIARTTAYVMGRPADEGGSGDPGPWTALGVFCGMKAAVADAFGDRELSGRTVLIQGVGDVGVPLAKRLVKAGANLKLSDIDAARARALASELGADVVDAEQVFDEPCDVFAPCAIGGVLNKETIPRLQCRVVAGSANTQLEVSEDADRLQRRGILYAPDFIINAGGAIHHAGIETLGMSMEEVTERTLSIEPTLDEILSEAKGAGESPVRAAERRAERVLERGPKS